jgi:hypothetical protein
MTAHLARPRGSSAGGQYPSRDLKIAGELYGKAKTQIFAQRKQRREKRSASL